MQEKIALFKSHYLNSSQQLELIIIQERQKLKMRNVIGSGQLAFIKLLFFIIINFIEGHLSNYFLEITNVCLANLFFANLFYYSAYFCYYLWVLLYFLVLFMSHTILF